MSVQTSYSDNLVVAFAGMAADESDAGIIPAFNTEASASIAYGLVVARDNTSPYDVNGNGAKLPAASNAVLMGVVRQSNAYSNSPNGDLDSTGLKPSAVMNVQRTGRIWAVCEDGCNPGDRLWVRYTSAGTGKGSLRATDAGGSTCIDATTKGEWQTKAAALGFAVIAIDFINK